MSRRRPGMNKMTRASTRRITTFSADDNAPVWNVDKLYGRDKESEMVQNLADETSTNILVLRGKAGSGKSYLVENQPWEEDGWVFATGKYEERRANEPYSALISALNDLVDQWAVNNASQQICKMGDFNELLEDDIVILRHLLPKAFDVAGGNSCAALRKPTVKRKSGGDATMGGGAEYVNASFWRILSFLCKPKPVVLFLDDIQWADQASLDAIKALATTGQVEGLLLVLAYRDEEIRDGDAVSKCLESIQEQDGDTVHQIHLTDLDLDNVNEIVSTLLRKGPKQTLELAEVVHSKTLGNPFFVIQFLQMLRQDQFLTYSLMTLQWEWGNVDKIRVISDNVADVVASTMNKLPIPTKMALKASSCLGKVIPLEVMIRFFDIMKDDIACKPQMVCDALMSIQMSGLKEVLDSAVKFGILTKSEDGEVFTWAHDKLQRVAYSMVPDEFKSKIHGTLGQILWKMSASHPEDEWMLYMAADQINRSALDDEDEGFLEDKARLSYEAAKLSMYKSAFFPALEMIQGAAKHLERMTDPWARAYNLCLSVYSGLAEVGVRLGRYDDVERSVEAVMKNATKLEDKFRVQMVMVRCRTSGVNRDYGKGVELTQSVLLDYGVKFPDKLLPGQQFVESRKLKSRLGGDLESLMNIRRLNDEDPEDLRHHHIIIMLNWLAMFAWMENKRIPLANYAITRAMNTSIKHGICAETAWAVCGLSLHLNLEGQTKEAEEYGKFALRLVNTFPEDLGSVHGMVYASVVAGVYSAIKPFNNTLDDWLEVNRRGLKVGDTEKASMGLVGYTYAYLCIGLPLGPLEKDMQSFTKEARQFGMAETIRVLFPIFHQTIKNLQETNTHPTLLKGEFFDEEKDLKQFTGAGLDMTRRDMNAFKLMLAVFFGKWDVAAPLVDDLEHYIDKDKWVSRRHHRNTYVGAASIILGRKGGKKSGHYRQLGKKVIKFFKDQVKNGSQNALPVVQLLEAIESPSKENFDEAIRVTGRLGLRQHQALLYEQAGLDFLAQNDRSWGEYYLSQACSIYNDWGATAKTEQLKADHYNLLKKSSISFSSGGSSSALQGRSRYNSEHADRMKGLNLTDSLKLQESSASMRFNNDTAHRSSSSDEAKASGSFSS